MRLMLRLRPKRVRLTCALCGPSDAEIVLVQGEWSVARCDRCELAATYPRPPAAVLTAAYEDVAYHRDRSDDNAQAWATRASQILCDLKTSPRSVLDFGAGEGHLVAALQARGIEARGVEPAAAARAAAASRGIHLCAAIDELNGRRFAAATLVHSLEHVGDPAATLRALRRILAPHGSVFIEVPHFGSADMWLSRHRRRAIVDLPLHLHHFEPHTLDQVARAAGFSRTALIVFNPTLVEQLLALRARHAPATEAPVTSAGTVRTAPTPSLRAARDRPAAAGITADQLLGALRRRLPGPKFIWVGRCDE